jgi:hypothetical protein
VRVRDNRERGSCTPSTKLIERFVNRYTTPRVSDLGDRFISEILPQVREGEVHIAALLGLDELGGD